jgi:preprotein translocase subunit SecE
MFEIYKRGQGRNVRITTFVAAMVIIVAGAVVLSSKLDGYQSTRTPIVRFGVPTLLVVLLGWLIFWMVNRRKSADFLIATEGEMKKVSWSSRREVVGSTKVVIVTTFIMAALLFGVDILFTFVFRWLGIMGA